MPSADSESIGDVADVLGVSRQRADQVSRFAGFPPPVGQLRGGRVWDLVHVRRWMVAEGRAGQELLDHGAAARTTPKKRTGRTQRKA
jgi:hypothetical protein